MIRAASALLVCLLITGCVIGGGDSWAKASDEDLQAIFDEPLPMPPACVDDPYWSCVPALDDPRRRELSNTELDALQSRCEATLCERARMGWRSQRDAAAKEWRRRHPTSSPTNAGAHPQ